MTNEELFDRGQNKGDIYSASHIGGDVDAL